MPTARDSLEAVTDGKLIYAIGGYLSGNGRLANVERYNPARGKWSSWASMLLARSGSGVGVVGKTIVAASGLANSGVTMDNEGYSPKTNAWKSLASEPIGQNASCAGAIGGSLYSAGGADPNAAPLAKLKIFNLHGNAWTSGASMRKATIGAPSAVVNGRLYCFGGANQGFSTGSTTYYDLVQIYQP
jgi:N-acetylneuraminic acid mutarotase